MNIPVKQISNLRRISAAVEQVCNLRRISAAVEQVSNLRTSLFLFLLLLFSACIKNDLPYPKIQQNIRALVAEGQIRDAQIDSVNLTATVYLDEDVDIENVHFTKFAVSEEGTPDPNLLVGAYNLESPVVVTITRFQSYQWLVKGVQNIERYFTVKGQIGESVIDAVGRRIIVGVPENADLSKIQVLSCKLGPAGLTVMTPDITSGVFDFSRPVRVNVECFNRSEEWTIYVERKTQLVYTDRVDAWSRVLWAYGSCQSGLTGTFEWRKRGDANWTRVNDADVVRNGGAFSVCIHNVEPLTDYEVRAIAGTNEGNVVEVTTEATELLPDGSFDQWWLKNNKIWCPWDENGVQYWDTGNTGAATLGQSNVVPSDYTPSGQGQSAELNTKFVGIGVIGKLAAGSIYTGSFRAVDGTNGILDFGRPWTLRPTKLKGYYQYKTADINYAAAELDYMKGQPDTCSIYVMLADWTAPFEIRTNPKNRSLLDRNASYVIGYGELNFSGTMDSYQPFVLDIKYNDTNRKPSYIVVCAAASKYGDYFTGGAGAQLYVDDFSLSYD